MNTSASRRQVRSAVADPRQAVLGPGLDRGNIHGLGKSVGDGLRFLRGVRRLLRNQ